MYSRHMIRMWYQNAATCFGLYRGLALYTLIQRGGRSPLDACKHHNSTGAMPRGSYYPTTEALGPQNHTYHGLCPHTITLGYFQLPGWRIRLIVVVLVGDGLAPKILLWFLEPESSNMDYRDPLEIWTLGHPLLFLAPGSSTFYIQIHAYIVNHIYIYTLHKLSSFLLCPHRHPTMWVFVRAPLF